MMIIGQFKNSLEVDDKWINTFMYYNQHKELVRVDSCPDRRAEGYRKMLHGIDQFNKTTFRLFIEL